MLRWLRRLLAAWFIWRLFGPEVPPTFDGPQEAPMRLPGRSVFIGDQEMFFRETGDPDGQPLVLIHGWGDHSAVVWQRIIPSLDQKHRIIALDNRNSGHSELVRERFDVSRLADEVAQVMDALGVDSAVVAGYSLGGMVAQELAHRHPHMVVKLILGGTAAQPAPRARERWGTRALFFLGRALDRVSRVELSRIRYHYLRRVGALQPRHQRWMWAHQMSRDPDLYWLSGFAALSFDSTRWIGRLDQPSLVIITAHDQLVPVAAQYRLAALIPDAKVVELDARHEAPLTHHEEIARAINLFLRDRPDLRVVVDQVG
jgi:pimeloyl-ACP methyl ester carboxylesterase